MAKWCPLRTGLAAAMLALASPAAAQNVGLILEAHRIASFTPAAPEAEVMGAGHIEPGRPAAAVSRVARRWGYVSLHAAPDRPVLRLGPLPFGTCGPMVRQRLYIAPLGTDGWRFSFMDCPEGVHAEWLLLPGGELLSHATAQPMALRRWAGTQPAGALAAEIARRRGDATPPAINEAPPPPEVEAAHRAALAAWRSTRGTPAQRGAAALAALGPALDRTDWFGGAVPAALVNDAGFWLQQSGGCDQVNDAVALFGAVLRLAPDRVAVRLNRADALTQRAACTRDHVPIVPAAEEYRLYCTAMDPERVPGPIAARIATALRVPRLDAAACRPRLGAHRAIAARDAAGLDALLAEHPGDAAEPDGQGRLPLAAAVAARNPRMVTALLRAGADPDRGSTSDRATPPLVHAAWNGDVATVRALIARRARVQTYGDLTQPLHAAAGAVRQLPGPVAVELMTLLLDARAPVDVLDGEERTTLMAAAGAPAPAEVIDLLVARGARIDRTSRRGRNAAHAVPPFSPLAVESLRALIAAGVNLEQQDRGGHTPLNALFGWSRRNAEVVREMALLMIAAGADPRRPNHEGRDAVFHAAVAGDAALLRAMLAVPARGPAPPRQDPVPLVRRRLAEAIAHPPAPPCPCAQDWQAILALLGAD